MPSPQPGTSAPALRASSSTTIEISPAAAPDPDALDGVAAGRSSPSVIPAPGAGGREPRGGSSSHATLLAFAEGPTNQQSTSSNWTSLGLRVQFTTLESNRVALLLSIPELSNSAAGSTRFRVRLDGAPDPVLATTMRSAAPNERVPLIGLDAASVSPGPHQAIVEWNTTAGSSAIGTAAPPRLVVLSLPERAGIARCDEQSTSNWVDQPLGPPLDIESFFHRTDAAGRGGNRGPGVGGRLHRPPAVTWRPPRPRGGSHEASACPGMVVGAASTSGCHVPESVVLLLP